jgi:hypothetical protein
VRGPHPRHGGRPAPLLVDLIRVFALTPRQWSTLMFALLPETDPSLVQAYRYLARDDTCRGLDGRLLAQLVYDTPTTRSLMARDLSPSSPLVRYRLVDLGAGSAPGESTMFRRIRAATRLVYLLDGTSVELDPELAEICELRTSAVSGEFPGVTIDRAAAALRSSEVVLALQGQRGLGKKLLLQIAAGHWGQRILAIDGKRLNQLPLSAQATAIRSLIRELLLLDAIPVFVELDDVTVHDGDRDEPGLLSVRCSTSGPVRPRSRSTASACRASTTGRCALTLEVPSLSCVPRCGARSCRRCPTRCRQPVRALAIRAASSSPPRRPRSPAACPMPARPTPRSSHTRCGAAAPADLAARQEVADPVRPRRSIVDDDTRAAPRDRRAARERRKIRRRVCCEARRASRCCSPATLASARRCRGRCSPAGSALDIYEVDLSRVVSKWLGETEKNLSDVFDAAEPGHVVLLFNEADSLFGKRTSDVKSSNDRYANLETNYLLQRLERFNGLAILTTNLTSAIDQAFKRRFSYDVFFSFPSPDMRAELWRRTIPERARAATIDYDALAETYELSGGFIKVACERAAYVAGAGGTEIDEELLRATIERMYRERGKVSAAGRLE